VAEVWYKLGSFTLEFFAFLFTWAALDFVFHRIRTFFQAPK